MYSSFCLVEVNFLEKVRIGLKRGLGKVINDGDFFIFIFVIIIYEK